MKPFMNTLLASDDMARQYGCGLKPALRAAIEADLRFPTHAASPLLDESQTLGALPENVVRIRSSEPGHKKETA